MSHETPGKTGQDSEDGIRPGLVDYYRRGGRVGLTPSEIERIAGMVVEETTPLPTSGEIQ